MVIHIAFPFDGELLIEQGAQVDFETPFVKLYSKEEVRIPLANLLHTQPKAIFHLLKKFVGEQVKKGDVIAEKKSLFSTKKYLSEYDGIFKEINHQDGTIAVEINTDEECHQHCFFKGEVTDIHKTTNTSGEKLHKVELALKVSHVKDYDLREASDFFGGEVVYSNDPYKAQLTIEEVQDKIIVDDSVPSYEQIKYEALGARGFISLHSLKEKSSTPWVKLKNNDDYKKIIEHKSKYCLVDKSNNKIYFYDAV